MDHYAAFVLLNGQPPSYDDLLVMARGENQEVLQLSKQLEAMRAELSEAESSEPEPDFPPTVEERVILDRPRTRKRRYGRFWGSHFKFHTRRGYAPSDLQSLARSAKDYSVVGELKLPRDVSDHEFKVSPAQFWNKTPVGFRFEEGFRWMLNEACGRNVTVVAFPENSAIHTLVNRGKRGTAQAVVALLETDVITPAEALTIAVDHAINTAVTEPLNCPRFLPLLAFTCEVTTRDLYCTLALGRLPVNRNPSGIYLAHPERLVAHLTRNGPQDFSAFAHMVQVIRYMLTEYGLLTDVLE